MEVKPQEAGFGDGVAVEGEPSAPAPMDLWDVAGTLYGRRKFIAWVTGVAALVSVVIALLLPRWYAAEARVLKPEGGGLSLLGMVDRATGGLGSLLGGGGEYTRYLAILTSRSMKEDVIERFDLLRVYKLEGKEHPMFQATEKLAKNVEFEVALDYDYLAVRAYDREPERAAAMANYLVERLNEENARLTSENARRTRLVVEQRLHRAEAALDSVRSQLQDFQETHGVVELETQAQAAMASVAGLKAEVARLEVQYQALAGQYGPDNPRVQAAREARNAAQAEVNRVLGGHDALLPFSMQALPALSRRYVELVQDQLVQTRIIETIYPLYEQAIFQEQSEAQAVQVIDEAVPPVLPARPSRRLLVVGVTLTAFLLACVFVLAQVWLRRSAPTIARRLEGAARRGAA